MKIVICSQSFLIASFDKLAVTGNNIACDIDLKEIVSQNHKVWVYRLQAGLDS